MGLADLLRTTIHRQRLNSDLRLQERVLQMERRSTLLEKRAEYEERIRQARLKIGPGPGQRILQGLQKAAGPGPSRPLPPQNPPGGALPKPEERGGSPLEELLRPRRPPGWL